ncbi:hypothetical protein GCM10011511_03790 [Puia dinghuensis]|uniref:Secretion system C-terminal sorting domain-containing protein n=1 Tax=Puia dinghuensis TaxID=1792502 RepID=A0A8J2U7D9_9BACT|nr:hypothetical protein GCM10011511_03790 [Puia dinghuensis]
MFCVLQATAQSYYPGGLGNSNLILWLNANKASSITMNGSNQVSTWADLSGNGFNFTQATTANEPVYGASANPSGRPGVSFTATSSQYLSIASLPATLSFTSGISAFAQVSYGPTHAGWGWQRIFDFGNGTANNNFMMGRYGNSAKNYYEGWKSGSGDQTYTTTSPIVNNSENLYEAIQQGGTAGTLTTVNQYLAGTAQAASGAAGSSQTWLPGSVARTSNYIGRSNWAADEYFNGTMSEILLYNTAVNTTQQVILENYLAAEWNQTVATSIYTPPTATTYTTNLVGIGYSGVDYFTADVAGSTDGLGFSSGTSGSDFLKNTGYIAAAHNGQANTVIAHATVHGYTSGSAMSKWNRSWYLQTTGGKSTGNVTISFNFSDYNSGLTAPSPANTYALLYNATDGTFATGTNQIITSTSTVSGSTVSFKTVASNLAAGYYTLLYSASPITLPVTLSSFTATAQGATAQLDWTTEQQTGFSRFDIQRAGDDGQFSTIGTVAAAANTNTEVRYTYTDANPLAGKNYYRLAMVDVDGKVAYSTIRALSFDAGGDAGITLTVYPNPVVDNLHLSLTHVSGKNAIRLLNSQGQVMRVVTATSPATVDMPVSNLGRGIYFVEVQSSDGNHFVREVLKQ